MKKSEIVAAIVSMRSEAPLAEEDILRHLSDYLCESSLNLQQWDQEIEDGLGVGIVKHVGAVKGDLNFDLIVRDVDIIVRRINS